MTVVAATHSAEVDFQRLEPALALWKAVRDGDLDEARACCAADNQSRLYRNADGKLAIHMARSYDMAALLLEQHGSQQIRVEDTKGQWPVFAVLAQAPSEDGPRIAQLFRCFCSEVDLQREGPDTLETWLEAHQPPAVRWSECESALGSSNMNQYEEELDELNR